jgi:hypothetical protein
MRVLSRFTFLDPSSAFSQQMEREKILKDGEKPTRSTALSCGVGGGGGFVDDGSLPAPSYDFYSSAPDLSVQSYKKAILCVYKMHMKFGFFYHHQKRMSNLGGG